MTITQANNKQPGVHTYYIHSDSSADYVVTHVRRAGMNRWSCTCPQWIYRCQAKGSHRWCKHIIQVVEKFAIRKLASRRAA